ncbi:MAG: ferredoxin thioredoxin reductase catalytic beta chain [archaeon]
MIKINPDKKKVKVIKKGIKLNDGYCPCKLQKINDNKCPCKEFKLTKKCDCGLYINIEGKDNNV